MTHKREVMVKIIPRKSFKKGIIGLASAYESSILNMEIYYSIA